MKKILLLLLLLNTYIYGQDEITDTDTTAIDYDSFQMQSILRPAVEPTYSIYNFANKINSKSQVLFTGIENNYQSVGINLNVRGEGDLGFLGYIWVKDITIPVNYFLPISKKINDTLSYKFTGYNFSINYGKDLFYSNKTFDLLPTYGYGFSNVTMTQTKNGADKKYRNPAFIFNLILESRLNLIDYKKHKLLSLGIKGGYQIDCSDTRWRTHKKYSSDFTKYRQTGLFIQGFISMNF